jgi:hypothetical protein
MAGAGKSWTGRMLVDTDLIFVEEMKMTGMDRS